jgi:DNA processing protein
MAIRSEFDPEDILGPLDEVTRRHAPERLYADGEIELLHSTVRVSVVGSRAASELAIRRTVRLATELLREQVVIVSGLAKGVDHAAHTVALDSGGRTIAVIATPLDAVYPKEHAALQARIATSGLVVSQFATGSNTGKWSFPARNRTMALLTHATVIVEAGEDSGSLHQGWEAIRLGRPLFFMRSLLDEPGPSWPHKLMEYGAMPLESTAELLDVLPSVETVTNGLGDL